MQLRLHVVPGDELPIYRQIMRQITDALAGGRLHPGDQLPSQRDLAEQLVISPLTVKKAYDELERDRVIETRRGRGTFVREEAPVLDLASQRERLRDAVRRLLSQAHVLGVPVAEVRRLLEDVQTELEAERARRPTSA